MARVSCHPPPRVCGIFPVLAQVEAENAKRKAQNESGGQRQPLLQPYILVMPQGGRDLAVVRDAEGRCIMMYDVLDVLLYGV